MSHTLPPVGGAGVQRCAKFIKYLRDFGWEPVALTVKNPSVPLFDTKQVSDIPDDCRMFRARTFEPAYSLKKNLFYEQNVGSFKKLGLKLLKFMKKNLLVPDPQISWWPGLIVSLFQVIRREAPSCIFVSAPPFSTLMAVTFVGKLSGIPVIVDYRDDWTFYRLHMENAVKTSLAANLDRIFERYVVTNCSAITAATSSYLKSILERNPSANGKITRVITNGFDKEDFLGPPPDARSAMGKDSEINFLYSGTVWNATSLSPLTEGLRILALENPNLGDEIKVSIYGRIVEEELPCLKDPKLSHIIELFDYVPHDEILHAMCRADVLIVALSDLQGAQSIIPAKTFEYMAAGKYVLAIVPEGETSKLLKKVYPKSSIVHPNDINSIVEIISDLIANKRLLEMEADIDLSEYERKRLTQRLSEVIFSIAI